MNRLRSWPGSGKRLATVAVLAAGLVGLALPATGEAASCKQPKGALEPPCNPYLADSPWSASHRGSYAQASSPYRGLETENVKSTHIVLPGIPIQIQFSDRYPDGSRVAWGSLIDANDAQALFKIDVDERKLIDLYVPAEREENPPDSGVGSITGAYNMLDGNGHFIVPRQRWFDVYEDSVKGDPGSPIKLRKRYRLPDQAFCGAEDALVGATMTYDGYIAFATERGVVGTIPRQPKLMRDENLRTLSVNEGECEAPDDEIETVSNNIAADEKGGIYVVTSERMRRFDHDGERNRLTSAWGTRYEAGDEVSEIRLGQGSGSTPTVMGTGPDQDKFVVITDGQDLMHVDLFWRNEVPDDWQGLDGSPRRIACEYPVDFGDPNADFSLSEQSVAVRGNGTLHVNNLLDYDFPDGLPDVLRNALAALRGGDPAAAPLGAERIDWNPRTQRCESVWTNRKVSIPNGIPSISERSGLAYGISQEDGVWGVRGLDWESGKSRIFAAADQRECPQEVFDLLERGGLLAIFGPIIEELPGSCQNSFYAATEVGPGATIWTGTFIGMTVYEAKGG